MSHVLRSAVAAASLFICSACATTGSFDRTPNEPIGAEATTALLPSTAAPSPASALQSVGALPQAQLASPGQASGPAPATSQASGQAPINVHGTASLVAWEQSQGTNPPPPMTGFRNLMFEPSDSRLRIVLDMRDFGPNLGSVGRVAIASNEEDDAAGGLSGIATLWAEPQPTPLEKVSDPDQPRDPLGGIVEDPEPLVTQPLVEPQATPEPGTLALAAVGLGMIGWHCRRIVRRLEFRA